MRGRALVSLCALLALGCARAAPTHSNPTAAISAPAPTAPTAPTEVVSNGPARAVTLSPAVASPATPVSTASAVPSETVVPMAASTALAVGSAAAVPASAVPESAQILSVTTVPNVVHTGESVSWNVRTTPDIVSVKAHVSAYTLPLQKIGPGHFALNFTVPANVPAFFHGTYNLDLIAESGAGVTAKRTVSMTFQ